MIRINKWPGLLTSASPYLVPAGGALEQINCQSLYPGQLSVRGGMKAVTFSGGEPDLGPFVEVWGYSPGSGASDAMFVQTESGKVIRLTNLTG